MARLGFWNSASMIGHQSFNRQPLSPAGQFFYARFFPCIFVIVGGLVFVLGVRNIIHAGASMSWPTVSGVVLVSGVQSQSSDNGTTYHAMVWYEFTVNQIKHSGTRVAFVDYGGSNPSHAQNIVNRYQVGAPVIVHYRSSNPDESVLEPGVKFQAWFMPVFGFVFLAVGSWMAVYLPREIRKSQPAEKS